MLRTFPAVLICGLMLCSFSIDSHAAVDLWKTGQSTVYTSGDDGDNQLGKAWPSPRFTDNGDGTIIDHLTNLMWLRNADCAQNQVDWLGAFTYIDELNTTGTMNGNDCEDVGNEGSHHTDWRLPNRKELISLLDYGEINPALPSGHPFTNVATNWYWSSSTYAYETTQAWDVSIGSCSLDHEDKTGGPDYVWAVRDYEPPASVAAEKFVPATVPTVTPWGVGCFALLLGAAGVFFLRRGGKAA